MNNLLSVCLIVCVAWLALTCSSGEDVLQQNPPGSQPAPSDNLTDEQRLAVLNECRSFVNSLGDFTSETVQQVIVAWIKTRPEFEAAGIESGNVWAYFHDGRMVTIVPSWLNKDDTGGRLPHSTEGGRSNTVEGGGAHVIDGEKSDNSERSNKRIDTGGRSQGIPIVKTGILFYELGTAFVDDRNRLEIMFEGSGRTRYQLTQQDATIDNLKAVKNEANAIVYILTHGGIGFKKIRIVGERVFSLWTKDTLTIANEEKYKDDINNGALSYQIALQDQGRGYEWHYAITQEFVKKYMSFAENAIVYVDACSSMNDGSKAFSEQVLDKCAKQKGTYVGWTNPTNAVTYIPTHRYIFDRMIAANDISGTEQSPPQRPFDFVSVYKDMLTYPEVYHLGVSSHGGRLAYNSRSESEVLLTPSISYILLYDYESKIVIHGMFGDDPGANGNVYINGKYVTTLLWSKHFIVCKIDDDGVDSSGDVLVMINDQASNVVPLTSWTIPLTVTRNEAGIKTEVKLTLKLRSDVHRYRTEPNATPITERWDSLGLEDDKDDLGWPFGKASTGHYSVGGVMVAECALAACQLKDTHTRTPKAGNLPFDLLSPAGLRYGAYYEWSRDLKKLIVQLFISIPDVEMNYQQYTKCPGADQTDHSAIVPDDFGIHVPSEDYEIIEFNLDDNYNITEGNKPPKVKGFIWSRCNQSGTLTTQITWPAVEGKYRPTTETQARVGG